jgi:superfamily I DNA/RNA helicase
MSGWNILEALPEGVAWRLEASAGTGKTYQIASIVLRLVAGYGVAVDKILVMTFTRAATPIQPRPRTRCSRRSCKRSTLRKPGSV